MRRSINKFARAVPLLAGLFACCNAPARADVISHSVLARLVRVCAPQVNSTTQAAIVAVESGGSPWVLHDDNDDHVYVPHSLEQAQSVATALLVRNKAAYGVRDRGVDVGLAQINSANFSSLGVTAGDMLDPCSNLHASARIIANAYQHERTVLARDTGWRGDERALERALEVYNSGRPRGDDAYVRAIFATLNGELVRDVGSGVRISPLPPVYQFTAYQKIAQPMPATIMPAKTTRARGSLFYHSENSAPAGSPAVRVAPAAASGSQSAHDTSSTGQ